MMSHGRELAELQLGPKVSEFGTSYHRLDL